MLPACCGGRRGGEAEEVGAEQRENWGPRRAGDGAGQVREVPPADGLPVRGRTPGVGVGARGVGGGEDDGVWEVDPEAGDALDARAREEEREEAEAGLDGAAWGRRSGGEGRAEGSSESRSTPVRRRKGKLEEGEVAGRDGAFGDEVVVAVEGDFVDEALVGAGLRIRGGMNGWRLSQCQPRESECERIGSGYNNEFPLAKRTARELFCGSGSGDGASLFTECFSCIVPTGGLNDKGSNEESSYQAGEETGQPDAIVLYQKLTVTRKPFCSQGGTRLCLCFTPRSPALGCGRPAGSPLSARGCSTEGSVVVRCAGKPRCRE